MRSGNHYNPLRVPRCSCKIDHSEISEHQVQTPPVLIYEVISQYEVLILMDLRVTWLVVMNDK